VGYQDGCGPGEWGVLAKNQCKEVSSGTLRHMRVKRLVPVSVTVVAAACSGHSNHSPARVGQTGMAAVGLVYAGGPPPLPSATPLLRPGEVRLTSHGRTTKVTVFEGRRTLQELAPGDYTVSGSSGDAACGISHVHVAAGERVPVTLICSVK